MIRSLPFVLLLVACTSGSNENVVSAMNYLMEPIDANCAVQALADEEGFAVRTPVRQAGGAEQVTALFNDDLQVEGIIRTQPDQTGEVSFFVKLEEGASPLDRREAAFAVRRADEAVYRACSEDGQLYGEEGQIVLDPDTE